MRILHCSTHEYYGGAAIAANRLHRGLLAAGVESAMAVSSRQGDTPEVFLSGGKIVRRILQPSLLFAEQKFLRLFYSLPPFPTYTTFSVTPSARNRALNAVSKDILHLHWINGGFLTPWSLAGLKGPIVWTMHDTWPFTGGCHYPSLGCERYLERCGRCPELGSRRERDLSRLHWWLKRRAIERIRPVIVSPSRAYAERAARSGLLAGCRVEHIPNGIDMEIFRPLNKTQARGLLGLPQNGNILLFGAINAAEDHNKGFDLLCQALSIALAGGRDSFLPLVFGAAESDAAPPLPMRFLGRLHDNLTLALAYSAADVFVCPSRQDNLPNTVLESLACGTPAVAFAVGGIPDMVEHGVNGYLAATEDADDLAAGIALLLRDADLRQRMGQAGREKVERGFSSGVVARRHIVLYEDILRKTHASNDTLP